MFCEEATTVLTMCDLGEEEGEIEETEEKDVGGGRGVVRFFTSILTPRLKYWQQSDQESKRACSKSKHVNLPHLRQNLALALFSNEHKHNHGSCDAAKSTTRENTLGWFTLIIRTQSTHPCWSHESTSESL